MGTGYDCFDERAHTDTPLIDADARKNRQLLSRAMEKEGFSGYDKEWWHFTYSGAGPRKDVMDFPITPLEASKRYRHQPSADSGHQQKLDRRSGHCSAL